MTRFLLDHGLPRSASQWLDLDEWDVVHAFDCGLGTASDERLIEFAKTDGRVICTLDADLHVALAMSGAVAPSVIRIRRAGLRGSEIAALLKKVWPDILEAIERGAVVSVTDTVVRVRELPLLGEDSSNEG